PHELVELDEPKQMRERAERACHAYVVYTHAKLSKQSIEWLAGSERHRHIEFRLVQFPRHIVRMQASAAKSSGESQEELDFVRGRWCFYAQFSYTFLSCWAAVTHENCAALLNPFSLKSAATSASSHNLIIAPANWSREEGSTSNAASPATS